MVIKQESKKYGTKLKLLWEILCMMMKIYLLNYSAIPTHVKPSKYHELNNIFSVSCYIVIVLLVSFPILFWFISQ